MYKRDNKGLTLIELMVVVAIAAILAAVAVPTFGKLIERQQIRQAAEALKSDKQLVRVAAIKRSADLIIMGVSGVAGSWCYGAGVSTVACNCTQTTTTASDYCSVVRVAGDLYPKTDITSVSANTTFSFRRGTANSSNTCLSTTNYKLKVLNNNGGKVEICSDTTAPVGGYDSCTANCP